jgi:membrane carboxypeptidase/penicillin-binding protein PbpC
MFRMNGRFFTNIQNNKVMDVHGNRDTENRNIIMWKRHGGLNQQWDIIYTDQWKGEPTKGQLNKEYGLYVLRDFHVVSMLGRRRYLDILGRDFVIKTPNGRNTQKWYFDQRSLTIKSKSNNQSWDIKNSGRTNNMQVWTTNSGWW